MWESLLANAIFFLFIIVVGGGWFLRRRRRLLKLFRVSRASGITIFLSRLEISPWTALGHDGQPRSFAGSTVTVGEATAASALGSIFEYLIPGLESQSGLLRTLLTRDIDVRIEASPMNQLGIPNDRTIVAVGSPAYNLVSAWAQQALNPLITFDANNASLLPFGQGPITDATQGMVQILWDVNHQRRVFYVGGLSEAGTVAALVYLARRWEQLRRNIGSQQSYAGLVRIQQGEPVLLSTIHPH